MASTSTSTSTNNAQPIADVDEKLVTEKQKNELGKAISTLDQVFKIAVIRIIQIAFCLKDITIPTIRHMCEEGIPLHSVHDDILRLIVDYVKSVATDPEEARAIAEQLEKKAVDSGIAQFDTRPCELEANKKYVSLFGTSLEEASDLVDTFQLLSIDPTLRTGFLRIKKLSQLNSSKGGLNDSNNKTIVNNWTIKTADFITMAHEYKKEAKRVTDELEIVAKMMELDEKFPERTKNNRVFDFTSLVSNISLSSSLLKAVLPPNCFPNSRNQ